MADLELVIEIITKIDLALSKISEFEKKLEDIEDNSEKSNKEFKLMDMSVKSLSASFAFLGATAGAAFKSMIDASPSLQIALFDINVELELMWLTLGEQLGPIIEDVIVPLFETFRSAVEALSPEMKQFIGITIATTVAISALGIAVLAVYGIIAVGAAPIVIAIIAIAAAVALVWGYFNGWFDDVDTNSGALSSLASLIEILSETLMVVWDNILIVGDAFSKFFTATSGDWESMLDGIVTMLSGFLVWVQGVSEVIAGIFSLDGELIMSGFAKIFSGIVEMIQGLMQVLLDVIVIGVKWIGGVLQSIEIDWIKKIGTDLIAFADTMTISNVPFFHEGGKVQGYGDQLAVLKPGETVRTQTQESALQNKMRGGTGMGNIYNFNFYNPVIDNDDRMREMEDRILEVMARQQYERGYS